MLVNPMSSFALCCDVDALQREPLLLLQVLQQFQTEGDDEQWRSLWRQQDWRLLKYTQSHLHHAAQQLDSLQMNSDPTVKPCKQHMAVYVAAVNLLFVALSLDDSPDHNAASHLALNGITLVPFRHACGAVDQDAVLLLRLQLLDSVLQHAQPVRAMIEPQQALERLTSELAHFASQSVATQKQPQQSQDEISVRDAALNNLFLLLGLTSGLSSTAFQSLLRLLSDACFKSSSLHNVIIQQTLTLLANESNDSRLLLVGMCLVSHFAKLQQPCTESIHLTVDELNRASLIVV